jgi:hypothetical protein
LEQLGLRIALQMMLLVRMQARLQLELKHRLMRFSFSLKVLIPLIEGVGNMLKTLYVQWR